MRALGRHSSGRAVDHGPVEVDRRHVVARRGERDRNPAAAGAQLDYRPPDSLGERQVEVDVTGVEPTAHAFPLVNVTRPDVVEPSLSREVALRNAPAQAGGLFIVPKIVD